jgi:hypothetical protein
VGQETPPRDQRRDTYTQQLQQVDQRTSCHPGNDPKASGSHARRDKGCNVELAIELRFSSSPVFAPVFSLSIGLMSQVQFSHTALSA